MRREVVEAELDPALSQQLLDIAKAQRESVAEPDRLPDHARREPMALVRNRFHEPPHPAHVAICGDQLQLG